MPAPMTREEREQFLAAVHVGILSINQPGRGPLTMPLWSSLRGVEMIDRARALLIAVSPFMSCFP